MGDRSKLVTIGCPNHREVLVERLWNFMKSKHRVDLHFRGAKRAIAAHHLIIDVFLSPTKLADSNMEEKHIQKSRDGGKSSLSLLLEFMYKGTVTLREEQLNDLLEVANDLDFQLLVDAIWSNTSSQRNGSSSVVIQKSVSEMDDVIQAASIIVKPVDAEESSDVMESCVVFEESCDIIESCIDVETVEIMQPGVIIQSATIPNQLDINCSSNQNVDAHVSLETETTPGNSNSFAVSLLEPCTDSLDESVDWSTDDSVSSSSNSIDDDYEVNKLLGESAAKRQKAISREPLDHYKCSHCDYKANTRYMFSHHMFSRHQLNCRGQKIIRLYCTNCKFSCRTESQMRYHKLASHSGEKPFACPHCSFTSGRKVAIGIHVRKVHLRLRPHLCEQCGYTSADAYGLIRHKRIHSGEKPFKCAHCSVSFSDHSGRCRHIKACHGTNGTIDKSYVCHVCGSSYNRRDNLRAHLVKTHQISLVKNRDYTSVPNT